MLEVWLVGAFFLPTYGAEGSFTLRKWSAKKAEPAMRACLWAWRCKSLLKNLMVTLGGVSTEWALLIGQRCEVRDLIRMLPTYPFTAITPPCSSSEDIVGEKSVEVIVKDVRRTNRVRSRSKSSFAASRRGHT